jgi:hypothetical protein
MAWLLTSALVSGLPNLRVYLHKFLSRYEMGNRSHGWISRRLESSSISLQEGNRGFKNMGAVLFGLS